MAQRKAGWSLGVLAVAVWALVSAVATVAQKPEPWAGALDEHPAIQYASRPTTDRIARLQRSLTESGTLLSHDLRTGYLTAVLEALRIPIDSQLLVFSKTGVQRAYTSPHNPRALYFDRSVVVGYIPGAPAIEIAAHDPQQGIVFYAVDQHAAAPAFTRRTSCLSCHVSSSTLDVPGLIARSNVVSEEGDTLPQLGSNDVDHRTGHADRWGGWFVTLRGAPAPYSQRGHAGNITSTERGQTSNGVFVDWMDSAPETRGYLSSSSDVVALLLFDHQARAINLLTRLNWEARIAATDGSAAAGEHANGDRQSVAAILADGPVRELVDELASYLLFAGEAPFAVPLTAPPGVAASLEAQTPKDRRGRSFGQLDLTTRLLRYPCSYLIYSEAFDGLPSAVKQAVYRRMLDILSAADPGRDFQRLTAEDRRAVLEILRETKSDFLAP